MFEEEGGLEDGMPICSYSVEAEVRKIWLDEPGIGVRDLADRLVQLFPPGTFGIATKQRVRAAKQGIPYRQLESALHVDASDMDMTFVQQKLEQRISYKAARQWNAADRIEKGLTAMGVEIDDWKRTWCIVRRPDQTKSEDTNGSVLLTNDVGVPCGMCGRMFGSRNLVFHHLRDPASGCGTSVFASGQAIPTPPSVIKKEAKRKTRVRGRRTGCTARHAEAASCLWIGDLPVIWTRQGGQYKHVRALLFRHVPTGVPTPWIKTVVRKSYRKQGFYRGFAIVVFRDAEEATVVLNAMEGLEVSTASVYPVDTLTSPKDADLADEPSFLLKVRRVEHNDLAEALHPTDWQNDPTPGLDPSLDEQLSPLDWGELEHRIIRLNDRRSEPAKPVGSDSCTKRLLSHNGHDEVLAHAVACYAQCGPRKEVRHQGRLIPDKIRDNLLQILITLRWPAQNERQGLSAERYLVLQTNVSNDLYYNHLRKACRELMDWADAEYYYSGIAVTKNFVASPHIDHRDQSFQYAVSLGGFTVGGELCVEGVNDAGDDFVNVVDTHDRIAQVDGRHPHWVRTWQGEGDRYSLIFYDTSDRRPIPINSRGVLTDWQY
jgi:hypothetical protein